MNFSYNPSPITGFTFLVILVLFNAVACRRCSSKSVQTEKDKATPYPINIVSHPTFRQPVPKSLSSHQLEQNTIRNDTRDGKGNEEVILKIYLDQDAFAYYSKARNCEIEENCVICFEALTTRWRLVPCGHASFCFDCSQKIFKEDDSISRCPLCRTQIKQVNSETALTINDSIHVDYKKRSSGLRLPWWFVSSSVFGKKYKKRIETLV